MGNTLVGPDGIRVRAVRLAGGALVTARVLAVMSRADEPEPGEDAFLVTRHGMGIALVRTPQELAAVVDLAELRPE